MNIGFEEYLLNKGYKKMVYDNKIRKLREPFNYEVISSLGTLDFTYIKEGFKDIIYGLYECNRPPIYQWPKPKSLGKELSVNVYSNEGIDRVFRNYSNEEIYKLMNEDNGK